MTKNGTTYYYHVNGHGDVVTLTDGSGNTVAQYSYDAWGNIISQSGTMASENPLRYAGYRYDEVTGLYYLMARYYDPNVGRFITRDTFHGYEDEPLSLNQYAYAKGNPVIYIDPSGHAAALLITIGIVIGATALEQLIAAGLALVIAGVTYIAVSEFLKRPKTYNHYMAIRQPNGLFIGNGLSTTKAKARLRSGFDTWSTSQYNAKTIAKEASPILKAAGPEIDMDGKGKLYHYHPISGYKYGVSIRIKSHAFYGSPR